MIFSSDFGVYQWDIGQDSMMWFAVSSVQARSQDLEKGGGGGYFERVRSVQTTLTRIFIDLESVSDGLSEN